MASKMLTVLVAVTAFFSVVASQNSAHVTQNCTLTTDPNSKTATTLSCLVPYLTERRMFSNYASLRIKSLTVTCAYLSTSPINSNSAFFLGMSELVELAIVNCKLTSLSEGTLSQINSGLKRLTVAGTFVKSLFLSETVFESPISIYLNSISQFVELEELSLYNNRLSQPPRDEYCQLPALKVLNLSANAFDDAGELGFNWTSAAETCAANLTILDISYNNLTSLPNDSFSALVNLEALHLRANRIFSVDQNAFFNLGSHLKFMDLSENYNTIVTEVSQWGFPNYLGRFSLNIFEKNKYADQLSTLDLRYYDYFDPVVRETMRNILSSGRYEISYQGINLNDNNSMSNLENLIELNLAGNGIDNLTEGVFSDLIRLKKLVLARNHCKEIAKGVFEGLSNLEELDMNINSLTTIEDKTFYPLTKLRMLGLDYNNIHNVSSGAFRNLKNLKFLYLHSNNLEEIRQDLLSSLPALEELTLRHNSFHDVSYLGFHPNITTLDLTFNHIDTIHVQAFHGMPNLNYISLSHNSLMSLPDDVFDKSANLSTLILSNNNFTHLPWAALQALVCHSSLVELDLSYNHVKTIDYELLPKSLVRLYLQGNDIESINQQAFTGLVYLEEIYLRDNLLRLVTRDIFPIGIKIIDLDGNQITRIDPDAFHDLYLLDSVALKGNSLVTLDASVMAASLANFSLKENKFICDCNLEWMQVYSSRISDYDIIKCCEAISHDHNCTTKRIKELLPDDFRCTFDSYQLEPPNFCVAMSNKTHCHLTCPTACQCYHRYNWTAIITSCSTHNLESVPRNMSSSSTEIHLDGNAIHSLSPSSFDTHFLDLTTLFFNNSQIRAISDWSFEAMENLVELHLQQNQLSTIKGDTFGGLKKLKFLWLSSNIIVYIDQNTFKPLNSLTELSLRDNSLQQLPDFNLKTKPNLTSLDIRDNPWNCSCSNFAKYQEYQTAGIFRDTSPDNSIHCRLQVDSIRPLRLFKEYGTTNCTEHQLLSDSVSMVLPLASSTTIFVAIIILCVLLYNYRHEIKVLIYSRYGIRFGRHRGSRSEGTNDGKLYDAFVAYSTQDRDFVAHELVQHLETGEHPYVLCLHERNFAVGSYIMESILEAVECSRRTIVVMSRHFMESSWCRFEFKSAHHHMLQDQRNRLIMIVLDEDIVDVEAEPNIKIYLKTNTYLARSDKLFWEKLNYAMPDRHGPPK